MVGERRHLQDRSMAKKFALNPRHPERICWGCDKYCPVGSLECGNGAERTPHPIELLGDDWLQHGDWGLENEAEPTPHQGSDGQVRKQEPDSDI